ncbi:SDR family NAD(P)-dependent oxidoreductase [Oxalobacteraceae bacterium OM1]|nr:SDR family NAD(P)-dependent oxidoreductase [Oxalobacteraceae bacterium OM1]
MAKLALITGGSRGLGAALCAHYAAQGFEVVEFSRSGKQPYSVKVDLTRPEAANAVFARTLQPLAARQFEEIVAINNAGVLDPIGPTSRKDIADVIANANANYVSAIAFITRVVDAFQGHAARKRIGNISSGAALRGYAGWSLYCAAKAGIEHFVRSVAVEQQQEAQPFTLVNIGPGVIDTEMQATIRGAKADDFPTVGRFLDLKANNALRRPEDVAAFVAAVLAGTPENGARYDIADGVPSR